MKRGLVIALLGAESTGKTTLARALAHALTGATSQAPAAVASAGAAPREADTDSSADARVTPRRGVAVVPETLREFCDRHGRTPRIDEQAGIAAEQTRRIAEAADRHDVVIADTTALMIAVYSEMVFGDRSLYEAAERDHRRADLTLLTALDLPWQPDGLQRDGPHVREPVDALLRAALRRSGAAYAVVAGQGDARVAAALAALKWTWRRWPGKPPAGDTGDTSDTGVSGVSGDRGGTADEAKPDATAVGTDASDDAGATRWQWHCERCDSGGCR